MGRFTGLGPLGAESPRILILGSFPSRRSLEKGEYYGHDRNHFWPILASVCGFNPEADYAERSAALARAGIALWDVIAECAREGSLDGHIRDEVPNPILGFLAARPSVERLALNGAKAASSFVASVAPELGKRPPAIGDVAEWRPGALPGRRLLVARLPSTSPIPTRDFRSAEAKVGVWADFLLRS